MPTRRAWLHVVARGFGDITRPRIRRGTFERVADLVAAIDGYLAHDTTLCVDQGRRHHLDEDRPRDILS